MEVIAPLPCAQLRREGASTFTVAWAPAGPCHTPATTLARVVPAGELRVLHADDDVVVVDKPAFLPTENTRWLKDSVRSRLERAHNALTCVHRLDWETSGCERAIQSDHLRANFTQAAASKFFSFPRNLFLCKFWAFKFFSSNSS